MKRDNYKSDRLVDFFIVGAPKAGTSSLYHYLDAHSVVVMSDIKEPNYFSHNETKNLYNSADYRRGYKLIDSEKEYHSLFSGDGISGECSVSYLYFPEIPARISKYNSEAKIVICLRDPVERALSHYEMDKRLGFTNLDLEAAIACKESVEYQQYIQLGRYVSQIKRYKEVFSDENILILWFDDIKSSPTAVSAKLCDFLGVASEQLSVPHRNKAIKTDSKILQKLYQSAVLRSFAKALLPKNLGVWVKANLFKTSKSNEYSKATVKEIHSLFKDEYKELELLLGVDLARWREKYQ